jgi:hypothetical protein
VYEAKLLGIAQLKTGVPESTRKVPDAAVKVAAELTMVPLNTGFPAMTNSEKALLTVTAPANVPPLILRPTPVTELLNVPAFIVTLVDASPTTAPLQTIVPPTEGEPPSKVSVPLNVPALRAPLYIPVVYPTNDNVRAEGHGVI